MAKRKRKQKKPFTNAEKIALTTLIFSIIKWLVDLVKDKK